jgi:hypothetical protein
MPLIARYAMRMSIVGLLLLAGAACAADDDVKATTTVYKRKVRTMEDGLGTRMINNPKGHMKSPKPYSDRSFSNPAASREASAEMRRRFEEAFGAQSDEAAVRLAATGMVNRVQADALNSNEAR